MKESIKFVEKITRARDELVRARKAQERAIAEISPNHAMSLDNKELYHQADIEIAAKLTKVVAKDIKNVQKKWK
jgi:hypothetical protein